MSGFALGSKWGEKKSAAYLNVIEVARELGIPIILFPQSFGPFEFGASQEIFDARIKSLMTYPKKIFAREHDGYLSLHDEYGLKNVVFHPDLVLASDKISKFPFPKSRRARASASPRTCAVSTRATRGRRSKFFTS